MESDIPPQISLTPDPVIVAMNRRNAELSKTYHANVEKLLSEEEPIRWSIVSRELASICRPSPYHSARFHGFDLLESLREAGSLKSLVLRQNAKKAARACRKDEFNVICESIVAKNPKISANEFVRLIEELQGINPVIVDVDNKSIHVQLPGKDIKEIKKSSLPHHLSRIKKKLRLSTKN